MTEVSRTPDRPAKTERPYKPITSLRAMLAASTAFLGCAISIHALNAYDGRLHKPTAQEALINDALSRQGDVAAKVRCLDRFGMQLRSPVDAITGFEREGMVPTVKLVGGRGLIQLYQERCNDLESFAANPPDSAAEFTESQLFSLIAVSHEYRHNTGERDEKLTQCQAMQTVGGLAVSLGMNPELALPLTEAAAELADSRYGEGSKMAPDERCVPGGAGDLGIYPAEQFPVRPYVPGR